MRQNKVAAASGDVEIYTVRGEDTKVQSRLPGDVLRTVHPGNNQPLLKSNTRYWLMVACAFFCLVTALLLFVVTPAMIMNAKHLVKDTTKHKQSLPLEAILQYSYSPKNFNGTWESDSEFTYVSESNLVMLHDMETMTSTNLIINTSLVPARKYSFTLSPDHKYLLVSYNSSKRYRHIYNSRYDIIDLEAQTSAKLRNGNGANDSDIIQFASWSSHGNALAYVYKNNVYYRASAQNTTEYQVTTNGVPELVYNGVADWIYNDANYGTHRALWFSFEGRQLAYATFNDSSVRNEPISMYGEPGSNATELYPNIIHVRYPKTGTPNPTAQLNVVHIDDILRGEPIAYVIPPPEKISDPILADVSWTNDDEVVAVWKNRVQTRTWINICNVTDLVSCQEVWKTEATDGWSTVYSVPRFSTDSQRMLLITPQEQEGDVGKFRHLTLIERGFPASRSTVLTLGAYTVIDIIAWDEDLGLIYIHATVEEDPASVQVFSVRDNVTDAPHVAECVTCGRRTANGDVECKYNTAYFSHQASFYMFHCWGPDIPEITLYNKHHQLLTMWEDNRSFRDSIEDKATPDTLRLQVPVPGNNMALVSMWLPPNMDPHTKYPLLVDVYAAPDSYQISNRFEVDWKYYLTCNKSIVYVVIDGRGSARKGDRMAFASYRRLGTVEVQDQISVTNYLLEKYDFLDKDRTAIWGWSYGGYSTLRVLANDTAGVFKCGMAIAPVTDWRYFTSMYTERVMGMPTKDDNLLGYQEANVVDKVDNLRNKKLFLAHGTFDNIVMYHHSMMLSRALQIKNIPFAQQSYPDEDHVLDGVTDHLYQCLLKFLKECFE